MTIDTTPTITLPSFKVTFRYFNHNGATNTRVVISESMRFGTSPWYNEPQWLLLAYDLDRKAQREFSMKNMSIVSYEEAFTLPTDYEPISSRPQQSAGWFKSLLNLLGGTK